MGNFAFIDAQNTYQGMRALGYVIDWGRFRIYLKDKYKITEAYIFIGRIPSRDDFYESLKKAGYILIFKPVIFDVEGNPKGNCDADLVLHAALEIYSYNKAVIVSSDGDFYSLVRYLYENGKLEMVLSSHVGRCSKLLKNEAKGKIAYMADFVHKIS